MSAHLQPQHQPSPNAAGAEAATRTPLTLLRLGDVLARVPLSKATIYRSIKAGRFPAPTHVGSSALWVEHEVTEWIRSQVSARDSIPR